MELKTQHINRLIINSVLSVCLLLLSFVTVLASGSTTNKFTLPDINIGVDLNRDGEITFDKKQHAISVLQSVNNAFIPTDKTYIIDGDETKQNILSYRFWLNNDLDVVNDGGNIKDVVSCDKLNGVNSYVAEQEYQQTCEQWDEDPAINASTNAFDGKYTKLNKIESYRDLEDFSPLKIQINAAAVNNEYVYELHAKGISVNLFKGTWGDAENGKSHAYIYDTATTKNQVEIANAAGNILLKADSVVKLPKEDIARFFKADGIGYFIFEGVERKADCTNQPKDCYISIVYRAKDDVKPLVEKRVYLDLHDIEDYYEHIDAGPSAELASTTYTEEDFFGDIVIKQSGFHAKYDGSAFTTVTENLNIYDQLYPPAEIDKDYVLQIHGWRMRDSEKKSFSETSFKRMYWSGYKGRMGALHWPTGWFEKAAHAYGFAVLSYVLGNERNYDISEAVARRVGDSLVAWLANNPHPNTHIVAHSMGNVVASEALLKGGVVTSYAASQAATASGSYDSNAADMQHVLLVPGRFSCLLGANDALNNVEEAWRCYNNDSIPDTPYDMPPDMSRYDWIVPETDLITGEPIIDPVSGKAVPLKDQEGNYTILHGPTTSTSMVSNGGQAHYYKGIGNNVNIVNLYNSEDAALTAWEFNQLTKPDFSQGKSWAYSNDYLEALTAFRSCSSEFGDDCIEPISPAQVTSIFKHNGDIVPYKPSTAYDIIAHVIPARTEPLGQAVNVGGEIGSNLPELDGLTDSNQDHSAPYHGYYSEVSPKPNVTARHRAAYWNLVLSESLGLGGINYTGLKNTIQ